jgi:uncharacterized surface protein with fasciclin (FAS1) repeats
MGFFDRFKKKATESAEKGGDTIVDAAIAYGDFKKLVEALKAAGLVDTLKKKGPYTVFAPTDSAFLDLPAGALDALLKDKAKLKDVLTYHVVAQKLSYDDLFKMKAVKTVQGKELGIDTRGALKVGEAYIITGNINCSNGTIHVISKVLLP